MKPISIYLLLILFSITYCNLFSQDIITKTDGTEIKAKIIEINTNDIKYKKFNYQDGPTITISKSELTSIKYPNGEIESFKSPTKLNKIAETNESNNSSSINKNGLIKSYYPSGELQSETPYVNGKIDGIQKLYYKTGAISSETPFVDGLANGISIIRFKNGKKIQEIPYVNGNINGAMKYYNKHEKVLGELFFVNNNAKVNKWGVLEMTIPYSNGIINGIIKSSLKKGGYQETPYLNNLANGTLKIFNKKGKLIYQANYVDGEFIRNGSISGDVAQGLQQGIAYNNMLTNTNTQTVNDYSQIAINNYTKNQNEALNANNTILENSTINNSNNLQNNLSNADINESSTGNNAITDAMNKNMIELNKFYNTQHPDKPIDIYANTVNYNNKQNSAESAASNNGGTNSNTGDSKELTNCTKQCQRQFENSQESKNMYANPDCHKMAYIAERKRVEIYLNNCRSLLPKADIDGLTQGLAKMQAHINSMPDCQNIKYGK